jgi:phosphomannomutase
MTKVKSSLKVSVSGVRGIVGDSLTPSLIAGFSAAFGDYVGKGRVLVGRDTRVSGVMAEHAVVAGLLSVGCHPVLAGIVPTPSLQMAVGERHAAGAVVISASHNDAEWNALKFIGPGGIFLNESESAELLDIYYQPDASFVPESAHRDVTCAEGVFEAHAERIFRKVDTELIKRRAFRVAADCCNGVGALCSAGFLRELGCTVVPLFDETDGVFRRPPEPRAENLTALARAVRENACDAGFAQDPDGDRIAVVTDRGDCAGEQYSLALAVDHVLSKTPGNVVANIQTTKAVEDIAAARGCKTFYSMVGEINVTKKILAEKAVVGGEGGSGGVIWPAVHPCRDSFSAMALVLEMMAVRKQKLSDILAGLPKYHSVNAKVPCGRVAAHDLVRHLRDKHAGLNPVIIDGIRLNIGGGWALVRPSNTEPALRITAEAADPSSASDICGKLAEAARAFLDSRG